MEKYNTFYNFSLKNDEGRTHLLLLFVFRLPYTLVQNLYLLPLFLKSSVTEAKGIYDTLIRFLSFYNALCIILKLLSVACHAIMIVG